MNIPNLHGRMYYLPKIKIRAWTFQICTDADTWHGSVENFLESISWKENPNCLYKNFKKSISGFFEVNLALTDHNNFDICREFLGNNFLKRKPKLFVRKFQEKHLTLFWGKPCFKGSQLFWPMSDGREFLCHFEIDYFLVGCIYMGTNREDK